MANLENESPDTGTEQDANRPQSRSGLVFRLRQAITAPFRTTTAKRVRQAASFRAAMPRPQIDDPSQAATISPDHSAPAVRDESSELGREYETPKKQSFEEYESYQSNLRDEMREKLQVSNNRDEALRAINGKTPLKVEPERTADFATKRKNRITPFDPKEKQEPVTKKNRDAHRREALHALNGRTPVHDTSKLSDLTEVPRTPRKQLQDVLDEYAAHGGAEKFLSEKYVEPADRSEQKRKNVPLLNLRQRLAGREETTVRRSLAEVRDTRVQTSGRSSDGSRRSSALSESDPSYDGTPGTAATSVSNHDSSPAKTAVQRALVVDVSGKEGIALPIRAKPKIVDINAQRTKPDSDHTSSPENEGEKTPHTRPGYRHGPEEQRPQLDDRSRSSSRSR